MVSFAYINLGNKLKRTLVMMRLINIFMILTLLAGAGYYWLSDQSQQPVYADQWKVQSLFFELPDITGKKVNISDWRGHGVLVNFWASWCPPCVEELPSFLEFAKLAKEKWQLPIFAISVDEEQKSVEKLLKKMNHWQDAQLFFTILMDPQAIVAKNYGVEKYPETFFLDANLTIIRKFVGPQNWTSKETLEWFQQNH